MDDTTENNMAKLVEIGHRLLNRRVYRVHQSTGNYQADLVRERTNRDELRAYAEILKVERDLRLHRRHDDQGVQGAPGQ